MKKRNPPKVGQDIESRSFIQNLAHIDRQVENFVKIDHKILHFFRYADTDEKHVQRLLGWAEFPNKAKVIDMGCGTGEIARLMKTMRKDLTFCLVNISKAQLKHVKKMRFHCCNFCDVPEPDFSFDAVMFCASIGHSALDRALCEAHRLLRPGGVLLISDLVKPKTGQLNMDKVVYTVRSRKDMEESASRVGFKFDLFIEPAYFLEFKEIFARVALKRTLGNSKPGVWRFVKN